MATLQIRLLGEFALDYDGAPLASATSPRQQTLLAYLVLHQGAPVSRRRLAYGLWPDSTEAQARTNLRNLLHNLLATLPGGEHFVLSGTQTLQWRSAAPFWLDVDAFKAAAPSGGVPALERAANLYRGELLPDCYEDWAAVERLQLEQLYGDILQRLIDLLAAQGSYRQAIAYASRLVRLDPLNEDACRRLMRLHALNGDRPGVRRAYLECASGLQREMAVTPSCQTRAVYESCMRIDSPVESAVRLARPARSAARRDEPAPSRDRPTRTPAPAAVPA